MRSTLAWLHARTENVAAALLAAMFVAFMLQIVFRYVINVPLEWTQEACLTTWLWAVFWGAAFNLRERDHVRFDVLYAMGGRGARRIMALISNGCVLAFFVLLTVLSVKLVTDEYIYEETSPAIGVPTWWYSIWLPVMAAAISLRTAGILRRIARAPVSAGAARGEQP